MSQSALRNSHLFSSSWTQIIVTAEIIAFCRIPCEMGSGLCTCCATVLPQDPAGRALLCCAAHTRPFQQALLTLLLLHMSYPHSSSARRLRQIPKVPSRSHQLTATSSSLCAVSAPRADGTAGTGSQSASQGALLSPSSRVDSELHCKAPPALIHACKRSGR